MTETGTAERYDIHGSQISKEVWLDLIERRAHHSYGIVGLDVIAHYLVETMWTGVATTVDSFGSPHIFETIVFKFAEGREVTKAPERWVYWKYSTLEDADLGHEAFLNAIRKTVIGCCYAEEATA